MPLPRPATIKALAGARAIPPLILVLFHYCEAHGYRGAKWFDLAAGKGYIWVEFFFALSGFVLVYAYGERLREPSRWPGYLQFLKARLARLYPLHIFMLFVILAMTIGLRALAHSYGYVSFYDQRWHPINNWQGFVASLFLVQAWNILSYLTWNGASWFVSVEWLMCLFFPLWLLLARGRWTVAIALLAGGAVALGFLATTGKGLDLTYHNGIYRGAAAFGMGVALAMIYQRTVELSETLPDYVFTAAQALVLAALWWGIYRTGWAHRAADIWTALPEIALIYVLAFDRGLIARFFQMRLLQFFGTISYAVYMGQTAVLQMLDEAKLHWYPSADAMVLGRSWASWEPVWHWLEPALILTIAVLWGWAIYAFVERPGGDLLKRWFAPRKRRISSPA